MLTVLLTNLFTKYNIDTEMKFDIKGMTLELRDYKTGTPLGSVFAMTDEGLILELTYTLANYKRNKTLEEGLCC